MFKKLMVGAALCAAILAGGANMVNAAYTNYNFYYDLYHATAPNNITKEDVAWGVEVGDITPEEYEQIVGEPYPG